LKIATPALEVSGGNSRAREASMTSHKYNVGQSVCYTSNVLRRFGGVEGIGKFRVVKLLPAEGSDLQYRIKSTAEPHERVAKESQLEMTGEFGL
jgi:hypothetical protein